MHSRYYKLGNLKIQLNYQGEMEYSSLLKLFLSDDQDVDCIVNVYPADEEEETPHSNGYGKLEYSGDIFTLKWNTKKISRISDWHVFNMIPVRKLLMKKESVVLHSSCIIHDNEVIIFSGPSGIGKSTQAALWEKYRGAQIINGDRTMIFQKEGKFFAGGYYISGSSKISKNEICPIKAIVLLNQGNENTVTQLSSVEKFKRLVVQFAYDIGDKEQVEKLMEWLNELIRNVDIVDFTCRKEETAVNELERYLYGKKN